MHRFSLDFLLIDVCHFLDGWIFCELVNVTIDIKKMGNIHILACFRGSSLTLWKYVQLLP